MNRMPTIWRRYIHFTSSRVHAVRFGALGCNEYLLASQPDFRILLSRLVDHRPAEEPLATCKPNNSTAIWDIANGKELASVPASRRITHGVTVSPDNRFAFVSIEGVNAEPGTVDVIDLQSFEVRASIDVGMQASGIDFWKIE